MRLRNFDKVVYHIFLSYFKIGACEVQNEIETKQNEMKRNEIYQNESKPTETKQNETKSNRNETKSKRNLSNETKRKMIEQNQIYIV